MAWGPQWGQEENCQRKTGNVQIADKEHAVLCLQLLAPGRTATPLLRFTDARVQVGREEAQVLGIPGQASSHCPAPGQTSSSPSLGLGLRGSQACLPAYPRCI